MPDAHDPHAATDDRLVVAISSRALFDLGDSHALFERDGLEAYRQFQIAHEDEVLAPGVAFPLVQKLLRLNARAPTAPRVEVILLSRNSGDTGLRIFNSIQHYGMEIVRAAFTSGAPTASYVRPFGADLFLSAHAEDVARALKAGVAAATILPSAAAQENSQQLRIAFDGDAVLFGEEGERISSEQGLEAFHRHERERQMEPLEGGPFRGFLAALQRLQAAFPAEDSPLRIALVTARSAPAHKRVILTLRHWGVRIDEALFLGG
ncbi:5'-nucleotidase, partial [Metallibacterium sp.]